jgi:8-oxo-dGTP pyrophosphatase MutT (NUDIX family)
MSASSYIDINYQETLQLVREKLNDHKPGQIKITDVFPAAVMILFLNKDDTPHLIFTKRTDLVETHKGQISFPGGVSDAEDSSLYETATRETWEEIGIHPGKVQLLGQLDDFYTVTKFVVTPFVGFVRSSFQYKLNHLEVAEVLEVPLSLFLQKKHFEVKKWQHEEKDYDVYFYYYDHHVIWGATAFILNRFIDLVFNYNPAPRPVREDPRNIHYLEENRQRKGSRES